MKTGRKCLVLGEEELEVLDGVPYEWRLAYLFIRFHMDVSTGISGIERKIAREAIADSLRIDGRQGIASYKPSLNAVDRIIKQLVSLGLVVLMPRDDLRKCIIFKLPLAMGISAPEKNPRQTRDKPATEAETKADAQAPYGHNGFADNVTAEPEALQNSFAGESRDTSEIINNINTSPPIAREDDLGTDNTAQAATSTATATTATDTEVRYPSGFDFQGVFGRGDVDPEVTRLFPYALLLISSSEFWKSQSWAANHDEIRRRLRIPPGMNGAPQGNTFLNQVIKFAERENSNGNSENGGRVDRRRKTSREQATREFFDAEYAALQAAAEKLRGAESFN